ncbi:hypothetical protein D5086_003097 [Populus alba]|uniref:Uncharacterized protein n=1 Tax=Populus alba TaxID=43335 RepID=A0ACC4D3D8_POPAL
MSNEHRDFYYHTPFQEDHLDVKPPSILGSSTYNRSPGQGVDPSSYMSFTECLHGSVDYNSLAKAFGLSPSSSEVFSSIEESSRPVEARDLDGGNSTDQVPATPNSSVSFSSSEAGGDEDSGKTKKETQPEKPEDGGENSDKKEGSASAMFSHSMLAPAPMAASGPGFPHHQGYNFVQIPAAMNSQNMGAYPQSVNQHVHQQYQVPDYGLLQDIVPSIFLRQEP